MTALVSHPHREHRYHPAWWVPGPHAQTLWGKFARRAPSLPTRLERWSTPDEDFVDFRPIRPGAWLPTYLSWVFPRLRTTFPPNVASQSRDEAGAISRTLRSRCDVPGALALPVR